MIYFQLRLSDKWIIRRQATGKIDADHPWYPGPAPETASDAEQAWTPVSAPMRSAYAVAGGGEEPEFTNFAKRAFSKGEEFCETLDYIWLSAEWTVGSVV